MEAILNSASDPSDLLNISDSKIPYHFDRIFCAEGFGAKGLLLDDPANIESTIAERASQTTPEQKPRD